MLKITHYLVQAASNTSDVDGSTRVYILSIYGSTVWGVWLLVYGALQRAAVFLDGLGSGRSSETEASRLPPETFCQLSASQAPPHPTNLL